MAARRLDVRAEILLGLAEIVAYPHRFSEAQVLVCQRVSVASVVCGHASPVYVPCATINDHPG